MNLLNNDKILDVSIDNPVEIISDNFNCLFNKRKGVFRCKFRGVMEWIKILVIWD